MSSPSDSPGITRRSFVAGGGLVVLAVVAGLPLPGLGAGESNPSTLYLVYDPKRCQGCGTCMMACSTAHHGVSNLSLARLQLWLDPYGTYPEDLSFVVCRQCVVAECVVICPSGACHIDEAAGGVRRVDGDKCVGCGACVTACRHEPSRMGWDPESKRASKCDLCSGAAHWGGEQPACVSLCPLGALTLVSRPPHQERPDSYETRLRGKTWKALGYDPT